MDSNYFYQENQEILKRHNNIPLLKFSYHFEALHASRFSTFEHAFEKRMLSISLSEEIDDEITLTWSRFELADLYRIFGQIERALPMYQHAITGFEKMDILHGKAYYDRAMGDIALAQASYQSAEQHYQNSLEKNR